MILRILKFKNKVHKNSRGFILITVTSIWLNFNKWSWMTITFMKLWWFDVNIWIFVKENGGDCHSNLTKIQLFTKVHSVNLEEYEWNSFRIYSILLNWCSFNEFVINEIHSASTHSFYLYRINDLFKWNIFSTKFSLNLI